MRSQPAHYEQDLYAWSQEQAALLREGAWQAVDLANVIEEIEDVGHSQRDAVGSHLLVLLTHLLKLLVAAQLQPHTYARAGRGWRQSCQVQRLQIAKRLRRNPSLRRLLPEECAEAYGIARLEAALALEVEEQQMPEVCPWTLQEVLDTDFWPEA